MLLPHTKRSVTAQAKMWWAHRVAQSPDTSTCSDVSTCSDTSTSSDALITSWGRTIWCSQILTLTVTSLHFCSLIFLRSVSHVTGLSSYSRFPLQDTARLHQWLRNIGRENWTPSRHQYICHEHFSPSCFKVRWGIRYLENDAVPTVFLEAEVKQQETYRGLILTFQRYWIKKVDR